MVLREFNFLEFQATVIGLREMSIKEEGDFYTRPTTIYLKSESTIRNLQI